MKRTVGFIALLTIVLLPSAQAFAMTQNDLYESYALAYSNVAVDAGLTADTSVDVGSDTSTDINVDASVDSDSSTDTNSDATVEEGSTFEFRRGDITNDTSASVTTSDMVSTRADLEAYAASSMQEDENFDHAEFSNTSVSVWYKHPAKLLGIVPMDMTVEAVADASGTVTVNYPWYSFLMSSTDKAELQAAIEQRLDASVNAETSSTFSTRAQAEVLADIRAALSASAE